MLKKQDTQANSDSIKDQKNTVLCCFSRDDSKSPKKVVPLVNTKIMTEIFRFDSLFLEVLLKKN